MATPGNMHRTALPIQDERRPPIEPDSLLLPDTADATLATLADLSMDSSRISTLQTLGLRTIISSTLPSLLEVVARLEQHLVSLAALVANKATSDRSSPATTYHLSASVVFYATRAELHIEEQGHLRVVRLTAQEQAVLRRLIAAPRQWFSVAALVDHLTAQGLLSSEAHSPERSVMATICQLRKKLGDGSHTLIRLNRRIGYAIFPPDPHNLPLP